MDFIPYIIILYTYVLSFIQILLYSELYYQNHIDGQIHNHCKMN